MEQKKALFHAVVTGITVCVILVLVLGIILCSISLFEWLCNAVGTPLTITILVFIFVVAVFITINSYKYFRKEEKK